jgi:hypothetical protein
VAAIWLHILTKNFICGVQLFIYLFKRKFLEIFGRILAGLWVACLVFVVGISLVGRLWVLLLVGSKFPVRVHFFGRLGQKFHGLWPQFRSVLGQPIRSLQPRFF